MDIIAETLRWVNAEREARGIGPALDELPRGQWRDCYRCPIALALNPRGDNSVEVCSTGIYFSEGEDVVDLPEYVAAFIDRFDNAEFPELVGKAL